MKEAEPELMTNVDKEIARGRETLVEHNLIEAVILSFHDREKAVADINLQFRMCAAIVPPIQPATALQPYLWQVLTAVVKNKPFPRFE